MDISIVIPVHNEEKNVTILHKKLLSVMNSLNKSYEIIFIDDGSSDKTYKELLQLNKIKIIKFRKKFGQSAAMNAGFKLAKGSSIISMDGDLQNDPADIPKLLKKLDEGYDVVCGWRANRKDKAEKKIFSRIANMIRNLMITDPLHDSGCSLRAYRKECFEDLDLMGEMHRFIPSLLSWKGFKIAEVKVNHFPRKYGKTNYGFNRLMRGSLDLFTVVFWRKYSSRPLHLFGGIGVFLVTLGMLMGTGLLIARQIFGYALGQSQLPLLAVLLVVIGIQFFISGLMADISIRNYYKNGKKVYSIKSIVERK